jgi:hypothetical protein
MDVIHCSRQINPGKAEDGTGPTAAVPGQRKIIRGSIVEAHILRRTSVGSLENKRKHPKLSVQAISGS